MILKELPKDTFRLFLQAKQVSRTRAGGKREAGDGRQKLNGELERGT